MELHYDTPRPHKWNWAYINYLLTDGKLFLPRLNVPEDEQACAQIGSALGIPREHIELVDTSKQGMIWGGQKNVMSRLLTTLYIKNDDGTYTQHVENPVLWKYFTMQDAIDYARYAIQVTIETMRFQRIVKTVGGPIDILAITPDGGKWISHKELK